MAKESKSKKVTTKTSAKKPLAKISRNKKQLTVRERANSSKSDKRRRIKTTAGQLSSKLSSARTSGKREFHIPLPDNKVGRILKKRVRFVPGFIKNSWTELRGVTWPNRNDTVRLTMAVFIFSVVFAAIVGVIDYGLDKLFREVIIKR